MSSKGKSHTSSRKKEPPRAVTNPEFILMYCNPDEKNLTSIPAVTIKRNSFNVGRDETKTHDAIVNGITHMIIGFLSRFMPADEINESVNEAVKGHYSPTHTEDGNFKFVVNGVNDGTVRTFVAASNFLKRDVPKGRTTHVVIVHPPPAFHALIKVLVAGHVFHDRPNDEDFRDMLPFLSPVLKEEYRRYLEAVQTPELSNLDTEFIRQFKKFTDMIDPTGDPLQPLTNITWYVPPQEETKEETKEEESPPSAPATDEALYPPSDNHDSTDTPMSTTSPPNQATEAPALISQDTTHATTGPHELGTPAVSNPEWGIGTFEPTHDVTVTFDAPDVSSERQSYASVVTNPQNSDCEEAKDQDPPSGGSSTTTLPNFGDLSSIRPRGTSPGTQSVPNVATNPGEGFIRMNPATQPVPSVTTNPAVRFSHHTTNQRAGTPVSRGNSSATTNLQNNRSPDPVRPSTPRVLTTPQNTRHFDRTITTAPTTGPQSYTTTTTEVYAPAPSNNAQSQVLVPDAVTMNENAIVPDESTITASIATTTWDIPKPSLALFAKIAAQMGARINLSSTNNIQTDQPQGVSVTNYCP